MQNHGASLEIAFVIKQTKNCQSRFDARYWMLGAGALGRPRGRVWGGRREEGSGWGTQVCIPVADSFRYLAKLIQFCKV